MQSSARRGIQFPSADRSDKPDIPAHFANLVAALEKDASIDKGIFSARPVNPGYPNYFWWSTDTHLLSIWDGSSWFNVGTPDVIAASLIDAKGDLIVGLSDNTPSRIGVGANGYHVTADNTTPSGIKWAMNALLDMITAKGDLLAGTGTDAAARVGVGTDGQYLVADSGQAAGIKWAPAPVTVPPGGVMQFAGSAAPTGWLICDGSAQSRTTYAALFTAIGILYGPGDGGTTFNIPDFRGRMPIGLGTHADVSALGNADANALSNRTPKHHHTVSMQSGFVDGAGGASAILPGGTTSTSGGTPLDSAPYLVVNYIIKT